LKQTVTDKTSTVSQWCTLEENSFKILTEIYSGQFPWLKKVNSAAALSELSRTKLPVDVIFNTLNTMKQEQKSLTVCSISKNL
jgi:hypothetical protein